MGSAAVSITGAQSARKKQELLVGVRPDIDRFDSDGAKVDELSGFRPRDGRILDCVAAFGELREPLELRWRLGHACSDLVTKVVRTLGGQGRCSEVVLARDRNEPVADEPLLPGRVQHRERVDAEVGRSGALTGGGFWVVTNAFAIGCVVRNDSIAVGCGASGPLAPIARRNTAKSSTVATGKPLKLWVTMSVSPSTAHPKLDRQAARVRVRNRVGDIRQACEVGEPDRHGDGPFVEKHCSSDRLCLRCSRKRALNHDSFGVYCAGVVLAERGMKGVHHGSVGRAGRRLQPGTLPLSR